MNDVCIFTQSMTPNQISAASGPTTGVRIFCAVGAIVGRVEEGISEEHTKNAKKKRTRLMKTRTPQTPPVGAESISPSHPPPEPPRNTPEKQVEPIRMNT